MALGAPWTTRAVDDGSVVAAARCDRGAILARSSRRDRSRDLGGGRRGAIAAAAVGRTTTSANHSRECVDAEVRARGGEGGALAMGEIFV